MVSTSTKTLFTKLKVLGAGDGRLDLSNNQVHALFAYACLNLNWDILRDLGLHPLDLPSNDYYTAPLTWFEDLDAGQDIEADAVLEALQRGITKEEDFGLFIHNLASLHKRRLKYRRILSE